ncbi:MAG: PD-(D/E)XK nuclease family protein, partial [Candidatus Marinimicrobia bacterium]|nr:PD-(D/E)XK nuclease family protein [Candidatus Neomarinimicrobiota bacterium]
MEEKVNLYKILSDRSIEQYPELSVVGWIDNGEKYLKINGIIDLLYRYQEEWFILDYKTDSDTTYLEKYKIQIQTYQWIVKQLFNIEAKGQIYFSAFNKLVSVEWNDEYFSKIFPDEKKSFSLTNFSSIMDLSTIKKIILKEKAKDILIINYTQYQSENMKRQLSNENLLSPNIKIKNLNEIIRELVVNEKRFSPSLLRLAVSSIVGKDEKRGTIRLLSDAINENEKYEDTVINFPDKKIVEKFNKLKSEKKLVTSSDILRSFSQNYDFSKSVVIINGVFEISDEKFNLFKNISKKAKEFYFIDNFNDNLIENNFNYDLLVWNKKVQLPKERSEQVCKICYSVYEEVDQLANDILAIPNWKNKIDEMKITVSSMNRYLPILKNIFSGYGIPLRFVAGNSLMEFPISQFILNIINLMRSQENWQDVRDVILDPFMNPEEKYFNFDKWVRGTGIEKFYQINDKISSDEKTIFDEIKQFIENNIKVKNSLFSIGKKLNEFVEKFKLTEVLKDDNQSLNVLKRILKIVKTISENYSILGLKGNINDFAIEFKERLKE